jgi:peptidoglycan/xylan/chitin deacetylase (PgdA/CDA1 family)
MDREKWERIEILLRTHDIKPLIAVIPNNADPTLKVSPHNTGFWNHLKELDCRGWEICMHGNAHLYHIRSGGINPVQQRSEFAGLSFEIQCEAIRKGYQKFCENNIMPRIFTAPSHTFDTNTLLALKKETPIRIISDTIAFKPYKKDDFKFVPQQFSSVRDIKIPGLYTISYHPGSMNDIDYRNLDRFLKSHGKQFISFRDLTLDNLKNRTYADAVYSFLYFRFRKIFR